MQITRTRPTRLTNMQIDGAGSDIVEGACIMPGVTDETDRSAAIVASGAAADAIGVLQRLHDFSVSGDYNPEAGTNFPDSTRPVMPFLPGCEVAAEIDLTVELDVAGYNNSTGVITITSLEDDIDGGWVYVTTTPGIGQLGYLKASASGSCTLKSVFGTDLTTSSKVVVMRPKFHALHALNTAADKIKSTAAAGSLTWILLRTEMRYRGEEGWIELDPTKHHNKTGLNSLNVKFRYIMSPRDTLFNPGS